MVLQTNPVDVCKHVKETKGDASTTVHGTDVCQITVCFRWFTGHPGMTWGISAAPRLDDPTPPTICEWTEKSGLTWPRDKTKTCSCQSQRGGFLCRAFGSPLCSSRESAGVHANVPRSRDDGKPQTRASTESALIFSLTHTGLLIFCGDQVYKRFPPKWSGRRGLGSLTLLSLDSPPYTPAGLQTCVPLFMKLCHRNIFD